MNPARDFGPRLLSSFFWGGGVFSVRSGYFWVPLFAPLLGGLVRTHGWLALIVRLWLRSRADVQKWRKAGFCSARGELWARCVLVCAAQLGGCMYFGFICHATNRATGQSVRIPHAATQVTATILPLSCLCTVFALVS